MSGDKPSFMTSTFSIITIVVVVGFVGLCLWMRDITNLKEIAMMVLSAYGVKKGIELQKTNGETKDAKNTNTP